MKELSQVWGQLTDVSQANILNLVGGKRNGNVVAALLNNFSIAEDVMKTAAESAGSAMVENEKYLDSIAGKIAVLKSSFEELSLDMIDTNLVKGTVDFATALVNVVDSLAKINMLLPAIVSAVVVIQAVRASNRSAAMQTQGELAAAQIADQLIRERTVSEELKVTYALLNEEVRESIRLKLEGAVASEALEAKDRDEIKTLLSKAAATNAVGEANKKVAIGTKVLSGMTPWGWVGIALSLLPALLSLYERLHKSNDELIQDAKELEDSFASSMSKTVSEIDQINGLRGEFDELSKGVSDYGKNISLSADEYERYQKIVQTIVGIAPSLVEGHDAEGKAIANKNGLIERTIELLEQERKLKLDEQLSDESMITLGQGKVAALENFKNKNINPFTGQVDDKNVWTDGLFYDIGEKLEGAVDKNTSSQDIWKAFGGGDFASTGGGMVEFVSIYYDKIREGIINRSEEVRKIFTEKELDALKEIVDEHDKNAQKYQDQADKLAAGMNSTLQVVPQQVEGYNTLTEAQKSFVSSYIDTMRISEDSEGADFTAQRDEVKDFTEALLESEDALKAVNLGEVITTGKGADGKSITIDEYRKQLRNFIQYVESIEDPELKVQIVSRYGTSGDDVGVDEAINLAREKLKAVLNGDGADSTAIENFLNNLTVDQATDIAYELKARDGSMTIEDIEEWLRERKQAIIHLELSQSFNAAYDKMKELYDMRDKLKDLAADGSDLDIDTFVELSKLLPDVIGGITDVASAQEALAQKIRESQHDVVNAYGGMVLANDEFIAGVLSNNKALADHMASYYGSDLSRFQELSKGKYAVDQALVQSLSTLWAKYSQFTTAGIESDINYLKNYVLPQMEKLDNGAGNNHSEYNKGMQDLRSQLKELETILAWRKEIEGKWDDLSNTTKPSSSSGKKVDAYIVDIDRYREALERLNNIRINKEDLEQALSATDNMNEKIRLEQELLSVYQAEQATLLEINHLRDQTILEGVDKLTKMGFQVDYDPENDKLFVRNMERINELAASSKGKYGSLQEATNALRKDTEELIETLENLNRENQDGTDDWQALEQSVRDAKVNIVNNLKEVVTQASEAVDAIQGVYDTLKEAADEYAANGGFISVDTFQKIVDLGPEYMQYLRDENNQLVINEESINRVIAAKTRQLALEQAMSYVARIRMALESGSVENLNTLLYATTETTNATWGLVYAELELMHVTGALNDQQYAAALHNIQAIQSLGENAAQNIGKVTGSVVEELNKMKSGLDDLLKYVMDMLRDKIKRQIEDLEEMKDAYADLIAMKKESLEKTDQETKYQDKVAKKVREIQKLQEKINALSLDDSRDAAAQKLKLEEEMAKLQEELAEMQSDHALETQQDSLDKMQEAYEEEKDKEIEALEDSISSEQKLYDMAIQYIKENWDSLYKTLIDWNSEYGSVLNSEITTAWENALAAAQKYGDYVTALGQIDADIEQAGGGQSGGSGGSGGNIIVGDTVPQSKPTDEDRVGAIIRQMYRNSKAWNSADKAGKEALNEENRQLGEVDLKKYGITAVRGDDGVWYVDRVGGERLFDRYRRYIYHSGGIIGDVGSLKENELLATMERGEVVVSNRNKDALFSLLDFANLLSKKMDMTGFGPYASVPFSDVRPDISDVVTNNAETIHFGDVYIYGANEDTVEKHREINRQFTNDILRQLNIKK